MLVGQNDVPHVSPLPTQHLPNKGTAAALSLMPGKSVLSKHDQVGCRRATTLHPKTSSRTCSRRGCFCRSLPQEAIETLECRQLLP